MNARSVEGDFVAARRGSMRADTRFTAPRSRSCLASSTFASRASASRDGTARYVFGFPAWTSMSPFSASSSRA